MKHSLHKRGLAGSDSARMRRNHHASLIASIVALSAALLLVQPSAQARADERSEQNDRSDHFAIRTLSGDAERVSGGSALVEITFPFADARRALVVELNGADVSGAFRPGGKANSLVGLVTGLALGENRLTVEGRGLPRESLDLTNYSIKGPIISGPQIEPFICQTQTFKLPDGTFLGSPLDADCSAPTVVTYVYLSTITGTFVALPSPTSLPADIAKTTTSAGKTVPYVVRVETGTINRGIYQNAILFDPTSDSAPSPFSPPKGWNKRVIAIHGAGCPGGWYTQGTAEGVNVLQNMYLSQGYALFINTLQNPSNSCNPFVAGESAMMGKEHFIKTFGVPDFTLSTGGSGGAYTSLDIADAFPGLIDVVGYASAVWNAIVPVSLRYDPVTNPRGARPTVWDVSRNIYGTDPTTGFALRTYDNVGVQYGLGALKAGTISKAQFLDLNQRIGGVDRDDNYVSSRTVGDLGALRRSYQAGLNLSGGGGLAATPIIDFGFYNEAAGYHYQWHHFAVRERLIIANGDADNHVFWRGTDATSVSLTQAFAVMAQWVAAIKADHSRASPPEKVIRNKPAAAVDGCYTTANPPQFIAEPQTFSNQPDSQCNTLFPSFGFPRLVAGGPLAGNNLKCELKPIDYRDYAVTFTTAEAQQLRSIFPQGVCNWSKPR